MSYVEEGEKFFTLFFLLSLSLINFPVKMG